MTKHLPSVIAFDLDATLWMPEMYELSGPPFKKCPKNPNLHLRDGSGEKIFLMGQSREILKELATDEKWKDTEIAYVSRTEYPQWAKTCLQLFTVHDNPAISMHDVSNHFEIYPGTKKKHFRRILDRTGYQPEDILFFDNESWNITEVAAIGICSVYTPRGMTAEVWQEGLKAFEDAAIARSKGEFPKLSIGNMRPSFW